MSFDIPKMLDHCTKEIYKFSLGHRTEHFYGFAIDANMMCLNSIEEFAKTLKRYQADFLRQTRTFASLSDMNDQDWKEENFHIEFAEKVYGLNRNDESALLRYINERRSRSALNGFSYQRAEEIEEVKYNTGDWSYQAFASIKEGFDSELYQSHYDDPRADSEYAKAMSLLVKEINQSGVFQCLNIVEEFSFKWVDHVY